MEMALFLTIAAVILIGGFKVYETRTAYKLSRETSEQMVSIKDALEKFKDLGNGQLPCAASLTAKQDTPEFGKAMDNCMNSSATADGVFRVLDSNGRGVRIGALPVRALGLPDSAMIDGWGNRIVYAVTEGLTLLNPPKNSPAALTIRDANGNVVSSTAGNVTYLAFSPGEDTRGAYNINGELIEPCDITALAGENCDNDDATFIASSKKSSGKDDVLTSLFVYGTKAKSVVPPSGSLTYPGEFATCVPTSAAEASDCPANPPYETGLPSNYVLESGVIVKRHEMQCPGNTWSNWEVVSDTCKWKAPPDAENPENCTVTSETKNVDCTDNPPPSSGLPPEYVYASGSATQKRETICPSGDWGSWNEISSSCVWEAPPSPTCEVVGTCTASIGYQIVCGKFVLIETDCPSSNYPADGGSLSSTDPLIALQLVTDVNEGEVDCMGNGIPICGANYCSKSTQTYNICQYETPPDNPPPPPPDNNSEPVSYMWKWGPGDDKSCHSQIDTDTCSCVPDQTYGSTMSEAYCQRNDGTTVSNSFCSGSPPGDEGGGFKTSPCTQCMSYRCP